MFRNLIFDQFQLDCVKYISSPSLSKDCGLKHSRAKIEHIKDFNVFNMVQNSIMGGISNSIRSYTKLDKDNEFIVYNDISSLYPNELTKNYLMKITNSLKNLMKRGTEWIKIMVVLCYVMLKQLTK